MNKVYCTKKAHLGYVSKMYKWYNKKMASKSELWKSKQLLNRYVIKWRISKICAYASEDKAQSFNDNKSASRPQVDHQNTREWHYLRN